MARKQSIPKTELVVSDQRFPKPITDKERNGRYLVRPKADSQGCLIKNHLAEKRDGNRQSWHFYFRL